MSIKFKFLFFIIAALAAVSCNSSKKNVEKDGSQDYSNFKRVGSVDTMQDAELMPGNIKQTDDYIKIANKGLVNELREVTDGGIRKTYSLGGKGNSIIKSSFATTTGNISSTEIYRKDGKLIYASAKEVIGSETKLYRYYFDGNKLVNYLVGTITAGDDKSSGGLSFQTAAVPAGKEAEIKNLETEIRSRITTISPFEGKVTKKGDGYIMTTCFEDQEYKILDTKGFITKSFNDNKVEPGSFLIMTIRGTKDVQGKTISVEGVNNAISSTGITDCF